MYVRKIVLKRQVKKNKPGKSHRKVNKLTLLCFELHSVKIFVNACEMKFSDDLLLTI